MNFADLSKSPKLSLQKRSKKVQDDIYHVKKTNKDRDHMIIDDVHLPFADQAFRRGLCNTPLSENKTRIAHIKFSPQGELLACAEYSNLVTILDDHYDWNQVNTVTIRRQGIFINSLYHIKNKYVYNKNQFQLTLIHIIVSL
jgi:hypothetical protein